MNNADKQYFDLMRDVLENGKNKEDRTGTGTLSVFGRQMRFNLKEGFPLLTTKKVFWRGVVEELLWMLRGDTNVRSLQEKNVHIWDNWADENGDLGRVYAAQWRDWRGADGKSYDQVASVIKSIKTAPDSRRHIVSAWNCSELDQQALPACHTLYQFYVSDGELSCQLYQRSADLFLGAMMNTPFYSLLTHMIAQVCGLQVGDFVHTFGDLHIYKNHISQVKEQLTREPRELPTLELDPTITNIDDFRFEHMKLLNYNPHPAIKAPIAV